MHEIKGQEFANEISLLSTSLGMNSFQRVSKVLNFGDDLALETDCTPCPFERCPMFQVVVATANLPATRHQARHFVRPV